jgi:hypothetical protein
VWIPAHYVASPGGYVFVEGYWDHPLEQRGVLFAPVRIDRTVIGASWTYSPQYVVQPDFLVSALFVRPDHCHYYFGDYFEARYTERGFVPWVDYRVSRGSFDPNFTYYRHRFGGDRTWETNLRELYPGRTRGDIARPPRTLVQQNTVVRNITVNKTENERVLRNVNLSKIRNVSVVTPVTRIHNTRVTNLASLGSSKSDVHKIEDHVIKMETVPQERKVAVKKAVAAFRETSQQRGQVESKLLAEGHTPVKATDPPRRVKVALPRAPTPALPPGPERPKAPPVKEVPRQPTPPRHEERPIPPHNPPRPPAPPRKVTPPPPHPAPPAPMPPPKAPPHPAPPPPAPHPAPAPPPPKAPPHPAPPAPAPHPAPAPPHPVPPPPAPAPPPPKVPPHPAPPPPAPHPAPAPPHPAPPPHKP